MSGHVYEERVTPGTGPWWEHLARYERVAGRLPRGAHVLDAGSGEGYGSALLARRGSIVTGVDLDEGTVESARSAYGDLADFQRADVTRLPFAEASFDAIACFEVIEHVPDPAALVAELARVLRPGGTLFLSTPHGRIELLHDRMRGRDPNPFHISRLTPARLRRLLAGRFSQVRLLGQTRDRGALHAAAQALDPFGLRVRVASRAPVAAEPPPGERAEQAPPSFRFSRALAHSSGVTFAEATR